VTVIELIRVSKYISSEAMNFHEYSAVAKPVILPHPFFYLDRTCSPELHTNLYYKLGAC
jgi:hypothetical protein